MVPSPRSNEQLFSSGFSTQMNVTIIWSTQVCSQQTLLKLSSSIQLSVVVVHMFVCCWFWVVQPLHHVCVMCAVCFWQCVFFNLQAGVSFCVRLAGDGQVCVEDVCVWFYGGVCARTVVALAACHGHSEGVRVLQFHLVLLWHFDEGAPSECVTETSTKPTEREEELTHFLGTVEHGKLLRVNICFTFGLDNSKL